MKTFLFSLVLAASAAHAQVQDPTRPPAEAMVAPAGSADAAALPAEPKGPRLESVLVGRGYSGREIAVIDGKIVRRGERFNGAVLVKVTPNTAVLKRGSKEEVLRLFPPMIEGKSAAAKRQ
ncbi:MSHA biogenesis protein MshK [Massilia endophytica]|uniref:MSHA biogenesis protein MshK n=1 Tax=Massilia endophytica TaxID=2899220 RepID=UPI001E35DE7E|nr:MSHA biogenesis protein MshK [Massilia endophytica]UGQ48378.1 MSHA biogenesis protein MshK [Massilia endophytica]